MDLREEFKKENGYGVMAVRQDYAGQRPYEDGFCDEYVEWLEAKVKKLSLHNVVGQSEQLKAEGRKEATEEIRQWLIDMDYEGLSESL